MTNNLIISPRISQHTPQPIVGSIDKNISFYCQGVNYNNKEIKIILLDGKNARDDVVGHYLVKKCLLDFDIYDEIEETGEDTLTFSNYGLKGFFKGSLTFKVLKVKDKYGADNKVKIEVADNLFNSNSKTILLSENNEQVKEVILSKKKSWEVTDKETDTDYLETDWSEIEGKTFTIENINGGNCYFENNNLILNDFGKIKEGERKYRLFNPPIIENESSEEDDVSKLLKEFDETEINQIEQKTKEYQELLKKYEEEVQKNKQLLVEKNLLVQQKKKNSETSYWEKNALEQQLKTANERIKKLEAEKIKFEKQLQDLHDFAKKNSTSRSSTPNNSSSLKTKLSQLQTKEKELKNKLEEEKKKNEDLTNQIQQLTKTNSVSLWQKVKKPVIIGSTIAIGVILIILLIYKYWKKIF